MIRIGLDVMGGDLAPSSPLDGVSAFLQTPHENCEIVLFGDEKTIKEHFKESQDLLQQVQIVGTSEVIGMGESPTKAIMKKPDSSIAVGMQHLKNSEVDVFISAGNTGAVLVSSMYGVKAAPGIIRPAIATYIPKISGKYSIMLDVGANPDVKPDVLHQFAILGSLYAEYVLNVDKPKVGLLNIGSEPEKGNLVTQAAYPLLADSQYINFNGNIEGYDVFTGDSDVMVCDGFVGNILLKTAESLYKIFGKRMAEDEFIKKFDYQYYGATPILGINKPVLIGHGISSPTAFQAMIRQAIDITNSGLVNKVRSVFEP